MKKSRRKFDSEFKRQAVRMVTDDGKSCRSVERDLGLGEGILYRWVREAKADSVNCFLGNGKVKPLAADVNQLLKENEQLRRQRDILKKALAIFSQTPVKSISSLQSMAKT
jgi:transposase